MLQSLFRFFGAAAGFHVMDNRHWRGIQAWMAERSKALDSSSSLFGGVGSNPTPSIEGHWSSGMILL